MGGNEHFAIFEVLGSLERSFQAQHLEMLKLSPSQIDLGLKIVSHLSIHECPGKINSAFNQSWDKEWFQLQAGISLYKGIRRKQGYPLFS